MSNAPLTAFDLETFLITPRTKAPAPVVAVLAEQGAEKPFLLDPRDPLLLSLWRQGDRHWVGHNMAYDLCCLLRWHPEFIPPVVRAMDEGRVWDTMLREQLTHLRHAGAPGFPARCSLASLAQKYLGRDRTAEKKDPNSWRLKYGTLYGTPLHLWPVDAINYVLADGTDTLRVFLAQGGPGAAEATEVLQVQASVALQLTSCAGFATRPAAVADLGRRLREEAALLRPAVARYLGPGSASALQADVGAAWRQLTHGILRQHGIDIEVGQVPLQRAAQEAWLGAGHPALEDLPVVPHTATGDLATGEDDVEPICHLLETLKWRAKFKHCEKMLKTYIEPCEDTESVHPSFSTVVTTGRTSARNMNTQNIPREEGFREMFQARPGHLLGTVDYSGLELVTLAATILHRYGRSQLADAINGGMDVHCKTAADFYGLDYEVVLKGKKQAPYKNMRQQSKAVNFGAPGGLGPPALSEYARTTYGVTMTIPECKAFLDRFKKQIWPDVGLYLRDQGSENRQYDGKLATAYNNMGRMKANCTYTQACNYPFQSLGADAAKWALWNLTRIRLLAWWHAEFEPAHELARHPLRNSRTVNFVHDEIVMEHPENLAQEAYAEQQRIMVAALGEVARGVKPAVEGALGPNWGH